MSRLYTFCVFIFWFFVVTDFFTPKFWTAAASYNEESIMSFPLSSSSFRWSAILLVLFVFDLVEATEPLFCLNLLPFVVFPYDCFDDPLF